LRTADPLSALSLAEHLNVVVWSVADVSGLDAQDVEVLSDEAESSWSALTMRLGPDDLVIYKPVRSPGRRNNVIMHELAHIILGHNLAAACVLEDGSLVPGNFSQDQEDEADWLAGTLLLPRPALLSIRAQRLTDREACDRYLVSAEMLAWRFRMTGVDYQLARRSA
jgi:hypothetical protein